MAELQTDIIEHRGLKFKPYILSDDIHKETRRIAAEITSEYKNKNPILIGILNGAFMWISDLVRELPFQEL